MAHVQRYRSGPVSEVRSKVKQGDVVEVGDLCALTPTGYVQDYALFGAVTSTFQDSFLGVLVQGGTAGNELADTDCLVYTDGEFEFPLSSPATGPHYPGEYLGPTGPQTVDFTVIGEAIGRLAKPCNTGDTTVLVRIMSVVMAPVALAI